MQGTRVVGLERGTSRAPTDAKVLVASLRSLHPDRIGHVVGRFLVKDPNGPVLKVASHRGDAATP